MINPAVASLLALLAAIVLSMTSRINVGLVSVAMAWIVGVYVAGLDAGSVLGGFPASLFLTLAGVTLLFSCAESNGTLSALAHRIVSLAAHQRKILPILFFLIALLVSTIGPGAISSVALVVPLAMVIGDRARVPRFLTALMVANGANAGNLSPISSVGVIANAKMAEGGLGGHEWKVWLANLIAHALVALVAWWALSGRRSPAPEGDPRSAPEQIGTEPFSRAQRTTLLIVLLWILGVLLLNFSLGLSAFAAAVLIIAVRAADETMVLKKVPWAVILMVCGVSVLVALLEETGGMELFTALLANLSSAQTVNGIIAFVTGAISSYSSTSGVVLPAFLPIAPRLAAELPGADPLAIALSINIGSSLVDVSPLSTLGALCVAAVRDIDESRQLFRRLLIWGLSMTVVGALFSQLCAGLIARL